MAEQEKRRYYRIYSKRKIKLAFDTETYDECRLKDLSLGGLFVKGKFSQKVGDKCYVDIEQTSKTTYLTFKANAIILRQSDEGIALRFTSMSFESMVLLELILLYEPRDNNSDTKMTLPTDLPFDVCEEEFTLPEE